MLADEVQHRAERLPSKPTQASAKLLKEQRRAVGRTKQQQRVDGGNVDALVEQVDREQRVDAPRGQILQRGGPFTHQGCPPRRRRPEPQTSGTRGP